MTTAYLYDGIDILHETRGGVARTYVHGPGIDEPLAHQENGAWSFYHADALGSIAKLTNEIGRAIHSYAYDAWGRIEVGAEREGFTFTGREWEPAVGLYLYRARWYDSIQGRFFSEDPIGFDGGVNFYSYVENRPVTSKDPFGLMTWGEAQGEGMTWSQWWNHPDTTTEDQINAETIDANPAFDPIGEVANFVGCRIANMARLGHELAFGRNARIAPFGNRTGHPIGRFPHYHRRGRPLPNGQTPPGQGIGRHRPWEKKSTDKKFTDRF